MQRNVTHQAELVEKAAKLKAYAVARREQFAADPSALVWVEKNLEQDLERERNAWRKAAAKVAALRALAGTKFKAADARAVEPFYVTVRPAR